MRRIAVIAVLLALAGAGSSIVLAATGEISPASPTVAATAPPAPVISRGPTDPTISTQAVFRFWDSRSGVSFLCSLDAGPYTSCSSPWTYYHLGLGGHDFAVEAVDANGTSSPTHWQWTVVVQVGMPFTITGAAKRPLHPGGPMVPVDLTFTNPNNVQIRVTSVVMSLEGTSRDACGNENFAIVRQLAAQPVVPAGATVSLSSLGIPVSKWPQLSMLDSAADQDSCKRVTLNLGFSGSAT